VTPDQRLIPQGVKRRKRSEEEEEDVNNQRQSILLDLLLVVLRFVFRHLFDRPYFDKKKPRKKTAPYFLTFELVCFYHLLFFGFTTLIRARSGT